MPAMMADRCGGLAESDDLLSRKQEPGVPRSRGAPAGDAVRRGAAADRSERDGAPVREDGAATSARAAERPDVASTTADDDVAAGELHLERHPVEVARLRTRRRMRPRGVPDDAVGDASLRREDEAVDVAARALEVHHRRVGRGDQAARARCDDDSQEYPPEPSRSHASTLRRRTPSVNSLADTGGPKDVFSLRAIFVVVGS